MKGRSQIDTNHVSRRPSALSVPLYVLNSYVKRHSGESVLLHVETTKGIRHTGNVVFINTSTMDVTLREVTTQRIRGRDISPLPKEGVWISGSEIRYIVVAHGTHTQHLEKEYEAVCADTVREVKQPSKFGTKRDCK